MPEDPRARTRYSCLAALVTCVPTCWVSCCVDPLVGSHGGFRSATWPELAALGRHLASAVDPTSGSTQQLTQHNSGATGNKLFYAGGLAMMTQLYDVTATVKGINKHFAWDVAPLPTGVKGLFDYVGGSAIGVSAQSKVKARGRGLVLLCHWFRRPEGECDAPARNADHQVAGRHPGLETGGWGAGTR